VLTAADKAVVCPVLIGRGRLVEALDRGIEAMASGHGLAVAVAGEAGIGKSRLVLGGAPRRQRGATLTCRAIL
jgi:hypothetical protein